MTCVGFGSSVVIECLRVIEIDDSRYTSGGYIWIAFGKYFHRCCEPFFDDRRDCIATIEYTDL